MAVLQCFQNPIIPGFAPDPSVVLVGDTFFLVTSSFHVFPGLPIYASRDLQSWTHIGNAIDRPSQLSLATSQTNVMALDTGEMMIATGGLFAATIRHHNNRFYIVCTNCGSSNGTSDLQNFLIHTSDIWAGNWSDPVPVDFHGIDPSLFFDDDDRAYFQGCFVMDRSRQPSCTIKQVEIDVETGKQLSEQREVWGGYARYDTEGPHVYKVDGWYYLLVAEGGTFEHHLLSIARSRDIWGPYESYEGNPVMTADGKDEYIQNVGHGELFQDAQGQWWAAVLGVRSDEGCAALGRESFLTPVEWPKEGWPQISQPRMGFERKPAERQATGATTSKAPPGVVNVYIRDVDPSKYRLQPGNETKITLLPSRTDFSHPADTCTFLGRRQRSLTDHATARLEMNDNLSTRRSIRTGLAMYRDTIRHVSIIYDTDAQVITCHAVNSATRLDRISPTKISVTPEARAIEFRIQASRTEWSFHARVEYPDGPDSASGEGDGVSGRVWTQLGVVHVKELDARDFTGPIYGIFARTSVVESEAVGSTSSTSQCLKMIQGPASPQHRPMLRCYSKVQANLVEFGHCPGLAFTPLIHGGNWV